MSSTAHTGPENTSKPPRVVFDGEDFHIDESLLRRPHPTPLHKNKLVWWGAVGAVAAKMGYGRHFVKASAAVPAAALAVIAGTTLAILVGGKPVSAKVAGWFLPGCMGQVDKKYRLVREDLLKGIRGRVLDFGSGGGPYIRYAIKDTVSELVLLEPNTNLHARLHREVEKRVANTTGPVPKVFVVGKFLESAGEADSSFDWIILGNVMCEVPDPAATFKELDRVLKPGGRVFFSEHVAEEEGLWGRTVQDVFAPWWRVISDGCHINRSTIEVMSAATGWDIQCWTFAEPGLIRLFKVGVAVKPKQP